MKLEYKKKYPRASRLNQKQYSKQETKKGTVQRQLQPHTYCIAHLSWAGCCFAGASAGNWPWSPLLLSEKNNFIYMYHYTNQEYRELR